MMPRRLKIELKTCFASLYISVLFLRYQETYGTNVPQLYSGTALRYRFDSCFLHVANYLYFDALVADFLGHGENLKLCFKQA